MPRNSPAAQLASRSVDEPPPVMVAGHEVTLFAESPPLIEAMLADIRAAQSRVWMETYIFADDPAGRAIAEALSVAAQAGRDVRLMVDGFGSFSTPQGLFDRMEQAGVQVHLFHTLTHVLRGPRWLQRFNQRNHRKLLIVDDAIAYFGGMNVVDQRVIETTADAKDRGLPVSAGWRDVHARMVGPKQAEIAALMDRLWNRVHLKQKTKTSRWVVPDFRNPPDEAIYLFHSRPALADRRPHRVLVPLIQQARRDITISMAYFIPQGRVLRELIKARKRGVRVRVIVPGQSDVRVVQWASRHLYEYLLKHGIRIYERHDRMLHSKAMVIDGVWSVIGSCNLDARSLRINLEFFAVFHSNALAAELGKICAEEMRASVRVNADSCRSRSCVQRQLDSLAWGFRKWL